MRFFTTAVLSALVTVSAAATIAELTAQIPSCALKCLGAAAKEVGCDEANVKCQCGKLLEMTDKSKGCIASGCSFDDVTKAAGLMPQICGLVAAEKGGDVFSSGVNKATSAVSAGLAGATSMVGAATKTGAPGAGATAPGAAGRNLAGVGFAAAVAVLAL
ncbi:hypothetical protein MAPG_04331 [Magnaporthiopsis poae ATCC 64411]|uniref:CFEM domain-containing protein n=1 Tax=Magnaporthiopsis poae (strain ATCC 64411 / 73-15) TaxID=644358 RepID=A0A0C4DWF5_MAGP6|nr:hypothetical protein MAPG_04331 [Magnaporthiopsis poae ATCC 64411]